MASLNKVFLIGNLTRDPELRHTTNGSAVTDLGVACNRVYTTKDGERREETTFIDVIVWNRQAETCCQYLKKGRPVHIEGTLRMDTWDDKATGEKRSKLRVEADRVQFLDRRDDPVGASGGDPDRESAPAPPPRRSAPSGGNGPGPARGYSGPAGGATPRRPAPTPAPEPMDEGDDLDDIPF
jgi:single-strand DNA-binding protein